MELSSLESIRALLRTHLSPTEERPRPGVPRAVRSSIKDRRVRCVCGHCPRCIDNAKWERIFAEKFADPNYYGELVIRASSPLASL